MCCWGGAAMFCSPGVFFSLPLFLPHCLPHHGDLDLEECAPCSVSGENGRGGGGGRKRNSSGSLTHFSIPPTHFSFLRCLYVPGDELKLRNEAFFFLRGLSVCRRVTASAEVSCFWMFAEALMITLPSFYKKQHEKSSARAFFFSACETCYKNEPSLNRLKLFQYKRLL